MVCLVGFPRLSWSRRLYSNLYVPPIREPCVLRIEKQPFRTDPASSSFSTLAEKPLEEQLLSVARYSVVVLHFFSWALMGSVFTLAILSTSSGTHSSTQNSLREYRHPSSWICRYFHAQKIFSISAAARGLSGAIRQYTWKVLNLPLTQSAHLFRLKSYVFDKPNEYFSPLHRTSRLGQNNRSCPHNSWRSGQATDFIRTWIRLTPKLSRLGDLDRRMFHFFLFRHQHFEFAVMEDKSQELTSTVLVGCHYATLFWSTSRLVSPFLYIHYCTSS